MSLINVYNRVKNNTIFNIIGVISFMILIIFLFLCIAGKRYGKSVWEFFGEYGCKKCSVIKREFPKVSDDIWVTGYIGDSAIGLALRKNKIVLSLLKTIE